MFRTVYLEPAHHRKHRGCMQIAQPCIHFARQSYKIMRGNGVDKWQARTCIYLLTLGGKLTQRYVDATAHIPKEAVGAF